MTDSATKKLTVFIPEGEHRQAKSRLALEGLNFQQFFTAAIHSLLSGQKAAAEPAAKNETRDAVRERRLQKIDAWLYRDAKKESEPSLSVKLLLAELLEDDDLRRHVRAQAEAFYAMRRK